MDTDEYDLLDLKMVFSLLESGTTDENLEETLSSLRERHSDRLRNKMAAQFRIDGSSLARDDFADVLINEVISNKVLSYSVSDSNSKLKVIGGKVSTKNIIPDKAIWDMGAPIYISLTSKRTYVSIVALVSEFQDNIADMVRYVF